MEIGAWETCDSTMCGMMMVNKNYPLESVWKKVDLHNCTCLVKLYYVPIKKYKKFISNWSKRGKGPSISGVLKGIKRVYFFLNRINKRKSITNRVRLKLWNSYNRLVHPSEVDMDRPALLLTHQKKSLILNWLET